MAGERFKETRNQKNKKQYIEDDTVFFESDVRKVTNESYEDNDYILGVYEGPIQKKTENNNGRVYQQEFWDHFFSSDEMQQRLEDKLMLGRLTHPQEGVDFDLNYTSHAVTDVWDGANEDKKEAREAYNLEDSDTAVDDLIFGRTEVFATEAGQDLHAMLEAGVRLGVSSRSAVYSSMEGGTEYVEEGEVFGWDYVAEPSVVEAVPEKTESDNTQITLPSESGCKLDLGNDKKVVEQVNRHETDNKNAKVIKEAIDSETQDDVETDIEETDESKTTNESDEDSKEDVDMSKENELDLEYLEEEYPEAKEEIDELTEEIVNMEDQIDALEEELDKRTERAEKAFNRLQSVIEQKDEEFESALKEAREHYQDLKDRKNSQLQEAKEYYQEKKDEFNAERSFYESFISELKNKFETKQEELESLEQEFEDTMHEAREVYQEAKENEKQTTLESYAQVLLEKMNETDNEKLEQAFLQADSIEEMEGIKQKVEKALEAKQSNLPSPEFEDDEKREVVEDVIEPESETTKRVTNIGRKAL